MTSVRPGGHVEFRFFRPEVSRVSVAGSFNEWREDTLSMEPAGDGWWVAEAELPAGEYRFRYVVDGQTWYTDYAAHGVELAGLGWNSVLVVPGRKRTDLRN